MKNRKAILLAIFLVTLVGCTEDAPPIPLAPEGTMIASLKGESWNSLAPTAIVANNTLFVSGKGVDGSSISFFVKGFSLSNYPIAGMVAGIVPENYVVHTTSQVFGFGIYGLSVSSFITETEVGEVRITKVNEASKKLSGTFRSKVKGFVLSNDSIIQISNGSFTSIPYVISATNPGSPASSALAKIEEADFVACYLTGELSYPGYIIMRFSNGAQSITLYVRPDISPGTLDLAVVTTDYGASYSEAPATQGTQILAAGYSAQVGTIVISSHDTTTKRIEGSFEFTGQLSQFGSGTLPSVQVTGGIFAVTYQ